MQIPSKKFLTTTKKLVKQYNADAKKLQTGTDEEKKLGVQKHKFATEIMNASLEIQRQGKNLEKQYLRLKKKKQH